MNASRIFIEDLRNGQTIDQVFLVKEKDLRTTKSGDYYISALLGDRTGGIPARMWQATEAVFNSIPSEGFLHVKGRIEDYKGNLQLMIDACRPVGGDKVEMRDFLAVAERDIDEMWSELVEILRTIKTPPLKRLVKKFLEDKTLVTAVKRSPAAMQLHQPYMGGLVEHTLNIVKAAQALLPLYPQLNADLVLAGIFLHDLGKSAELTSGLNIRYTDRGQLVGHITIAAMWVQEKARAVAEEDGEPFPGHIVTLLQHLILSHHGMHEYGSPKLPAIPESFFIHYLDNLDAKIWMTAEAIASDPDKDSHWTSYQRQLETRVYKHSGNLGGPEGVGDEENAPPLFEDRP
ncbi:MAG: HD domain-containing protein [Planctomycetes bacterium]|jgi:3'-5' exoribonuclease|nr:HD domain-containing protein [Planctomycetota bacterium]